MAALPFLFKLGVVFVSADSISTQLSRLLRSELSSESSEYFSEGCSDEDRLFGDRDEDGWDFTIAATRRWIGSVSVKAIFFVTETFLLVSFVEGVERVGDDVKSGFLVTSEIQ